MIQQCNEIFTPLTLAVSGVLRSQNLSASPQPETGNLEEGRRKKLLQREYSRRYKQRNREKIAHDRAKYFQENKDKINSCARRHYAIKPENHKARQRIAYALARGWITRPSKCDKCGIETKPQAHHNDYTKPLEVQWLCQRCHAYEHRKIN